MTGKRKKIVIVGLPNTGKSHLFNNLTGKYTLVGNYPFTTVEINRSTCKIGREEYDVIDTPGLHCLYIHSEEELIVRDLLIAERPDVLIQCIDANHLKQSLSLTADLLELDIPMMIVLNAIEETTRKGFKINVKKLSSLLGVEVVESVTVDDINLNKIKTAVLEARCGNKGIDYGRGMERAIDEVEDKLPKAAEYRRKLSVLLLLKDPYLMDYIRKRYNNDFDKALSLAISRITQHYKGSLSKFINRKKGDWVNSIAGQVVVASKNKMGREFREAFGRLSRHPVVGIFILVFFLVITFLLVVNVAGAIEGWMSGYFIDPSVEWVSRHVPDPFWNDFLVGSYGILTIGVFNAIGTILPILTIFFLMFGFMEDIGYIPNLCVLTKRIFEKLGLTGKAIMPIVLGFGCKTMATLVTRGLVSRKEKFIAVFLIAFAIPCSAQLAIDMGILGRMGLMAFFIAYGVLALVELIAGVVLNKILKDEQRTDFIQQLPQIRVPNPKAIIKKTYYRIRHFSKEAIPIFILAACALFIFERTGILDISKNIMRPLVVNWLGLPIDILDVLILSIARHEAAAGLLLNMVDKGALTYVQSIVAVVITTMFVPCFANVGAIFKEMGVKTGIIIVGSINILSFIVAGILNWVLVLFLGR